MIIETLNVKGMHCKSCVMLVEEAVSEIKGIKKVEADYNKDQVTISYDGSNTTLESVKKAIKEEGYQV